LVVADGRNTPAFILQQCETFEFHFIDGLELTCLPCSGR
jgi:hypothetical protein